MPGQEGNQIFILVWHTAFGMTPVFDETGGQCGCFGMGQVFCELRCMECEMVFRFPEVR